MTWSRRLRGVGFGLTSGGSEAPLVLPWRDYLRHRPLPFRFWFLWRRYKQATLQRFRPDASPSSGSLASDGSDGHHLKSDAIEHNQAAVGYFHRDRMERTINVLRSIRDVDAENASILVIGPRNEAELLLLSTYGFRLENISAIDLFSFSPLIEVMDMHELEYPDDTFDVVFSSYVLWYSTDIRRACHEMARVVKPGGLVAVAFAYPTSHSETERPELSGGLGVVYDKFDGRIDHVFWQEEHDRGDGKVAASAIFRVRKSSDRGEIR